MLKSKQVVSLAKRISNKFFQCPQSSPPASTRSLQLPFVFILHSPGFELQTSDFKIHLHLYYATQAIVANLLIFSSEKTDSKSHLQSNPNFSLSY